MLDNKKVSLQIGKSLHHNHDMDFQQLQDHTMSMMSITDHHYFQ